MSKKVKEDVEIFTSGRDQEQSNFIDKFCEENKFETGSEWLNANIKWLSNSSTTDLPLDQWFFRYIYLPHERHKFSRHSRMEFGKYADEYSAKIILGEMTIKEAMKEIRDLVRYYVPSEADPTDKIRVKKYLSQIENYINEIIKAVMPIKQSYEQMVTQYPIILQVEGVNCLFIGYLDFAFLNNGKLMKWVELKTAWANPTKNKYKTNKVGSIGDRIWKSVVLPDEVKDIHSSQLAIYSEATQIPGDILYVVENEHILFEAQDGEDKLSMPYHKSVLKTVRRNALVRQNLLKLSKDPNNLFQIIQPDFSHWKWKGIEPEYLEKAKQLWLNN